MLGGDQGAAHLSGDFAFADDRGVESRADGKKVLADFGAGVRAERPGHELFAESAGLADLADQGGAGGLDVVRVRRLAVDFVAVAGGKDNRTRHCRRSGEGGCGDA